MDTIKGNLRSGQDDKSAAFQRDFEMRLATASKTLRPTRLKTRPACQHGAHPAARM